MTNQLASLARRDYFYLDAFWRVNLVMYIIMFFSINLLVFYHECRSLIGYATRYLFCDR